jgi:hypothetical protein
LEAKFDFFSRLWVYSTYVHKRGKKSNRAFKVTLVEKVESNLTFFGVKFDFQNQISRILGGSGGSDIFQNFTGVRVTFFCCVQYGEHGTALAFFSPFFYMYGALHFPQKKICFFPQSNFCAYFFPVFLQRSSRIKNTPFFWFPEILRVRFCASGFPGLSPAKNRIWFRVEILAFFPLYGALCLPRKKSAFSGPVSFARTFLWSSCKGPHDVKVHPFFGCRKFSGSGFVRQDFM